jgi:hypothetical protein
MKVSIRDPEVLHGLSPIDVRAYLLSQGWHEGDRISNKATVHTKPDGQGNEREILLPTRHDVGDYVQRMAEAVRYIAQVEDRSELEVLADLQLSGYDVVRIRTAWTDDIGTIPVVDGVELLEHGRNMLLASACAAIAPRPTYHTRKPDKAIEYLQSVRLGQTERGSYILTLLSPVGPALRLSNHPPMLPGFEDDPFERQVTRILASSLAALKEAVSDAAATDKFAPFENSVPQGVSANLCEAVAGLCKTSRGVELGVSWARVRPAPTERVRVSFSKDSARILDEAAREFRAKEPLIDHKVVGFVTKLVRETRDTQGVAILDAVIEDKPRRVRAILDPQEYSVVVKAHDERRPIICEGDLYRVGKRLELRNPRGVTLFPIGDEDSDTEQPG